MSTATNEPFSPSGTSGQLTIGGVNVASGASVTSLIRTDWQGAVTLSTSSRTNLSTYSEQINNAAWTLDPGIASITANATAAPDGNTTADGLVEDSASSSKIIYAPSVTFTAATYVWSIYAKAAGRSWLGMTLDYTGHNAYFNLSTGVKGSVTAGATSGIQSMGNGWYRCWISMTMTAGAGYGQCYPSTADGGTQTYTGAGTTAIYAWGGQVETGSTPTGYIPTTTTSASITDYSYTSAGVVTLGQTASGTYVWNGSGTLAAGTGGFQTNAFQNNAFDVVAAGGDATGTPTGVAATGSVNTPTASGIQNPTVSVTGVSGTGSIHAPTGSGAANATATGVAGTGSVNAPTAVAIKNPTVSATGVAGTGSVNAPTAKGDANAVGSGVSGTGSVGTATASASGNATGTPSGVSGTASQGSAVASGEANASATGVSGTGNVGSGIASGAANVVVFGVSAAGAVGTATASGGGATDATAYPDGVVGIGLAGDPIADVGTGDNQPIRIFYLKRKKRREARKPLVLDVDSNFVEVGPIPAEVPAQETATPEPKVLPAIVGTRRVVDHSRWITVQTPALRIKAPMVVKATVIEEDEDHALRLFLLLAS